MRYARIVVFSVLALAAAPSVPDVLAAEAPAPVHLLRGAGFLQALACGACLGSGAALMASGWGAVWTAVMAAGDGALAGACVDACASLL